MRGVVGGDFLFGVVVDLFYFEGVGLGGGYWLVGYVLWFL